MADSSTNTEQVATCTHGNPLLDCFLCQIEYVEDGIEDAWIERVSR